MREEKQMQHTIRSLARRRKGDVSLIETLEIYNGRAKSLEINESTVGQSICTVLPRIESKFKRMNQSMIQKYRSVIESDNNTENALREQEQYSKHKNLNKLGPTLRNIELIIRIREQSALLH